MNRSDTLEAVLDYSEDPVPHALAPFVCKIWRLDAGGHADEVVDNRAVPDGCVELIRRERGTSDWDGPQPGLFVAGLCSQPAALTMSGDARFTGVRLWPWAWNLLGEPKCPQFHDRWLAIEPGTDPARLMAKGEHLVERLAEFFAPAQVHPVARHVPACGSPGELAQRSGSGPRQLQRWFRREIGLSPRAYYRLLRFQHAVNEDAGASSREADRAADAGYADQAHMTREFRRLSGETPARQRMSSAGPFLPQRDS